MSNTTLEISSVAIDDIVVTSDNPRTTFEMGAMDELTESVRAHGVLVPIILWRRAESLTLVSGERRLRAAEAAGLTHIPARILEGLTHDQARAIALVENLQRVDLGVIDEAEAFAGLLESGQSVSSIASAVSRSEAYVRSRLELGTLTGRSRNFLRLHGLGISYATELAKLSTEQQHDLLRIHAERLYSIEPQFDGIEGQEVVSLAQFRAVIRDLFSQPEQELPMAEEPEQVEAEPAAADGAEPEVESEDDEQKKIADAARTLQGARQDPIARDWHLIRPRVLEEAKEALEALSNRDCMAIIDLLLPEVEDSPFTPTTVLNFAWRAIYRMSALPSSFTQAAKILRIDVKKAAKGKPRGKDRRKS